MKVALIPCGATEWHLEGRLLGRVELAPTSESLQRCAQWARQLADLGLSRIVHAPDELARQTAATLARQLAIPTKALEDLAEVDIGLWAGLTESQLKARFASAHRELRDSPLNVNPPGGESLRKAASRLSACIDKQLHKNGNRALAIVMRPFAFAIVCSALQGREISDLLETARRADQLVIIDYDPGRPPAVPG